MRRTVLAVVILVIATCLFASGTQRDAVKVYFTVGTDGSSGGSQLWRCNRDGSDAERLLGSLNLRAVEVEPSTGSLYLVEGTTLLVSDLYGSGFTYFAGSPYGSIPSLSGTQLFAVDENGGYVCWAVGVPSMRVYTALADGSDEQFLEVGSIPDMVSSPVVADVAIHVSSGSPVEHMSWGKIKASFR